MPSHTESERRKNNITRRTNSRVEVAQGQSNQGGQRVTNQDNSGVGAQTRQTVFNDRTNPQASRLGASLTNDVSSDVANRINVSPVRPLPGRQGAAQRATEIDRFDFQSVLTSGSGGVGRNRGFNAPTDIEESVRLGADGSVEDEGNLFDSISPGSITDIQERIDLNNSSQLGLGVINNPDTIRAEDSQPDFSELPLQTTSRRIGEDGTEFNFNDGSGSISTRSSEGASRIANGLGIRGGQVGTFNTDNFIQGARSQRIQDAVAEGNRLGTSPSDLLDVINNLENPGQGGSSRLEKQLDRIDRLERSGAINGSVAASRRSSINRQITNNRKVDVQEEGIQEGAREFAQQQQARGVGLSISQFNAQTNRAKAIAQDFQRNQTNSINRLKTLRELIDNNTSLGVLVSNPTLAVDALGASDKAISSRTEFSGEFRDATGNPDAQRDILKTFQQELGLPDTALPAIERFFTQG